MEAAGQIASNFNASVLKEPRGFLKLIQFVLSIFAFATTTSFSSSSSFKVNCNATVSKTVKFDYEYPFDLESVCVKSPVCNATATKTEACLLAGAQSSSQFYVFVGVIVMLYCLAALILYIFFDELYRKNNHIIVGGLCGVGGPDTAVAHLLLGLGVRVVQCQGVHRPLPRGGFFDNVSYFPDCKDASKTRSCEVLNVGNYGSLNASVIFGFLNMMVWVGNLWFLYKETPWFKVQAKPPAGTPGQSPGGANVY